MRLEGIPDYNYEHYPTDAPDRPLPARTTFVERRPANGEPEPSRAQPEEQGGFWSFLGGVVDTIGSVVEGAVDSLFGIGRSLGVLFTHPSRVPGELAENVAGAAILVGGKAVSGVQTLVGLEPAGRRLTDEEAVALYRIFGDSIDFGRVRIKEGGAGLFSANARPFAHGNTIYTKDEPVTLALLAHELVHVWQYQQGGPDYMPEALTAQAFGDAYDWKKAVTEGKTWSQLDPEQQAELVKDAFRSGYFTRGELEQNQTFRMDGVDYTVFLRNALAELRAGRGAP